MKAIKDLEKTVKILRGPDGCPWDKEQTFQSLTPYILEEAYELVEAMEEENPLKLKEELGDVLLHVLMLSGMAAEKNYFNLHDVADSENKKMIHRHPHVFGDKTANSVEDVWNNWESAKKEEKNDTSIMDSIPKLPALMQAQKIQKKAARVGFDWPDKNGPLEKLKEEVHEFEAAFTSKNTIHLEEEAGDLLFAFINCLRKCNINAEDVLRKANTKFMTRFKHMESHAENFESLSLSEKEIYWEKAKKALKETHSQPNTSIS